MTMLNQASPSAETPLLDVKDLAQRYTLPRESCSSRPGRCMRSTASPRR